MPDYVLRNKMESHGHGLPLISDDKNRTELQATLQFGIIYCTPVVSLSAPDSSDPIEVTLVAKQKWSKNPTRPLTICAHRTPFDFPIAGRPWTGNDVSKYLHLRSISNPSKTLLGDRRGAYWVHESEPDTDNWQSHYGFITIPSQASGHNYQLTRHITRDDIFWRSKNNPEAAPRPGEEFHLVLDLNTRYFGVQWWNWGSLEDDLKEKKFIDLPDPRVNGREDRTPPPDPYLLPFGCWEDREDDEGNEMGFLEVESDSTPVRVKFVE